MNLLLISHISIALSSVGLTFFTFMSPTTSRLNASYGLIALTLISGTFLVISVQSSIVSACISGLVFVSGSLFGTFLARQKLARQNDQNIDKN